MGRSGEDDDDVRDTAPALDEAFERMVAASDYQRLGEWIGYFTRAIDDDGWPAVVATWVPRLMPAPPTSRPPTAPPRWPGCTPSTPRCTRPANRPPNLIRPARQAVTSPWRPCAAWTRTR